MADFIISALIAFILMPCAAKIGEFEIIIYHGGGKNTNGAVDKIIVKTG